MHYPYVSVECIAGHFFFTPYGRTDRQYGQFIDHGVYIPHTSSLVLFLSPRLWQQLQRSSCWSNTPFHVLFRTVIAHFLTADAVGFIISEAIINRTWLSTTLALPLWESSEWYDVWTFPWIYRELYLTPDLSSYMNRENDYSWSRKYECAQDEGTLYRPVCMADVPMKTYRCHLLMMMETAKLSYSWLKYDV